MTRVSAKTNTWNKPALWPCLVEQTARATRLTAEEKERLAGSLAAEVIAATAYLSGCTDPDRVAVAHLTTFIAGIRCPELYSHRNGESLAHRLTAGHYFPGGDPEAIRAGMLILELISLNDHRADFEQDLINGKANPLVENLNYDQAREKIESAYKMINDDVQKSLYTLYTKTIYCGSWFGG